MTVAALKFLFVLTLVGLPSTMARNIVCYFIGLNGYKLIPPEDLNSDLCTHIIYAFVHLKNDGNLTYASKFVDVDQNMYKRVADLKKRNPDLKVMLSVAAKSASIFSEVFADEDKTENFIENCVQFIKKYSFDGIDIDWEKPLENDKVNFVKVLKQLRAKFDENSWLLSAALFSSPSSGYDVIQISNTVHMINLMTYDYFYTKSTVTGQNAPLFPSSKDSTYQRTHLNVAASVRKWINSGAAKEKINMGLAFYGRKFTLLDPDKNYLHAPVTGPGKPASLTYGKICNEYDDWTTVWDDEQKNPYKYRDYEWLSYDNEQSIKEKVKFLLNQDLGGAMIWHLGGDDLKGNCGEKQSLLRAVNEALNNKN